MEFFKLPGASDVRRVGGHLLTPSRRALRQKTVVVEAMAEALVGPISPLAAGTRAASDDDTGAAIVSVCRRALGLLDGFERLRGVDAAIGSDRVREGRRLVDAVADRLAQILIVRARLVLSQQRRQAGHIRGGHGGS